MTRRKILSCVWIGCCTLATAVVSAFPAPCAAQFGTGRQGGGSGLPFFGRSGRAVALRAATGDAPLALQYERIKLGSSLFHRDWLKEGRLDNSAGLGLGPVYNSNSCVACHKQGTNGGAGDEKANVDLLSLTAVNLSRIPDSLHERISKVHPGFANGPQSANRSLVLHTSRLKYKDPGQTQAVEDEEYATWRKTLLRQGTKQEVSRSRPTFVVEGVKVRLTQRNTPALYGSGLIDAIPDHVIVAISDEQKERNPEIQGRVPRASSGSVGRFGWRGQVDHLHDFVLGACANELGLQVPGHNQPRDVEFTVLEGSLRPRHVKQSKNAAPLDLTAEQCLSLSTFVGTLMPPTRSSSASLDHAREITEGEKLFAEVGCATCHRADVGPVQGIYSDLLLHDMGVELGDPLGANPDNVASLNGYYGSSEPAPPQIAGKGPNLQQEWRTPPLWGVSDSGPWLHDGRATTMEEAIRLHGGQGRRAAREFAALTNADRGRILEFLGSLAAPRVDGTTPAARVMSPTTPVGSGIGFSGGGGLFNLDDR